jgi:hypothetical protein
MAWVAGFPAAAALAIGQSITVRGAAPWTSPWFYLVIAALTVVFAQLAAAARRLVERPRRRPPPVWRNRRRAFWFDWAVIWLAWTPVWLSGWPGFWCYDAATAYRSAQAGAVTTAMPPIHTIAATAVQDFVSSLTGSNNYGIAAWIAIQSLTVAAVFAHTLRRLRAWRVTRAVRWGGLAYFALFPTIALFSLNWARNTLFSAVVLALAVNLVDALKTPSRRRWLLTAVLAFAAIALRRDAIYVFLLFTVLLLATFRPARKALAICFAGASLAGLLLDPLVYKGLLGLAEGDAAATYSAPLQQLARAYNQSPAALTADQARRLEWYVKPEALAKYRPQLADPVILGADGERIERDAKGFFGLWAEVGASHPGLYADALAAATVQGWLPGAVIDAYSISSAGSLYPTTGTSYFCYSTEPPGVVAPKGPALVRQVYAAFSNQSRTVFEAPVLGWLWSPGTYAWLFAFSAALSWARGRRGRPSAFYPVALVALASCAPIFLGPAMLTRYFLQLFYCLPLAAAFLADPRVFEFGATSPRPPGRGRRTSRP